VCGRARVCVGGACGSRALVVDRMMEAVMDVETCQCCFEYYFLFVFLTF